MFTEEQIVGPQITAVHILSVYLGYKSNFGYIIAPTLH